MSDTLHLLSARDIPRLLSFVVPVFNEEEVIPLLAEKMQDLIRQLPCSAEVIFVNDGSTDGTVSQLRGLALGDPHFKVLCLARNFGHQAAATAGLDFARGDAVILMDADLQDPPELAFEMLSNYQKGYDVVYAQRVRREGESIFKRWSAWLFYRLMELLVYKDLPPDVGDFRLISRRCLDALKSLRETHRFLRGMVSWVGFPQTAVPFVRPPRVAGQTKYPLRKMLLFAWTAAVSFSPAPLRISFYTGGLLVSIGIIYGLYAIAEMFLGIALVPGWTSLIVLNCISSGAIMLAIGVLGEYIARIFEESKRRPLYIVSDRYGLDDAWSGDPISTEPNARQIRTARDGDGLPQ